ncbi:NAD-P-binding protein [Trametes maxima]|nr:NAD-P-binding protein [Trametes maxima]
MPVSYAIIGASRGIGLEYVRQLAKKTDTIVFAIVRNKQGSKHLAPVANNYQNVHVVEGDVADYKSLERAAQQVSSIFGGKLDYLIHNAAKMEGGKILHFADAFKVNAVGTVHSITAFLPLLRAGTTKKIVVIASGAGLPQMVYGSGIGNMVQYGTTKAAQILITTKWALTLKDEGFVVVSLNPGHVSTAETNIAPPDPAVRVMVQKVVEEMRARGLKYETQTAEASVKLQLQVIGGLKESDNGAFYEHTGEKLF